MRNKSSVAMNQSDLCQIVCFKGNLHEVFKIHPFFLSLRTYDIFISRVMNVYIGTRSLQEETTN